VAGRQSQCKGKLLTKLSRENRVQVAGIATGSLIRTWPDFKNEKAEKYPGRHYNYFK
jgi:hypothetical protein